MSARQTASEAPPTTTQTPLLPAPPSLPTHQPCAKCKRPISLRSIITAFSIHYTAILDPASQPRLLNFPRTTTPPYNYCCSRCKTLIPTSPIVLAYEEFYAADIKKTRCLERNMLRRTAQYVALQLMEYTTICLLYRIVFGNLLQGEMSYQHVLSVGLAILSVMKLFIFRFIDERAVSEGRFQMEHEILSQTQERVQQFEKEIKTLRNQKQFLEAEQTRSEESYLANERITRGAHSLAITEAQQKGFQEGFAAGQAGVAIQIKATHDKSYAQGWEAGKCSGSEFQYEEGKKAGLEIGIGRGKKAGIAEGKIFRQEEFYKNGVLAGEKQARQLFLKEISEVKANIEEEVALAVAQETKRLQSVMAVSLAKQKEYFLSETLTARAVGYRAGAEHARKTSAGDTTQSFKQGVIQGQKESHQEFEKEKSKMQAAHMEALAKALTEGVKKGRQEGALEKKTSADFITTEQKAVIARSLAKEFEKGMKQGWENGRALEKKTTEARLKAANEEANRVAFEKGRKEGWEAGRALEKQTTTDRMQAANEKIAKESFDDAFEKGRKQGWEAGRALEKKTTEDRLKAENEKAIAEAFDGGFKKGRQEGWENGRAVEKKITEDSLKAEHQKATVAVFEEGRSQGRKEGFDNGRAFEKTLADEVEIARENGRVAGVEAARTEALVEDGWAVLSDEGRSESESDSEDV